MLFNGPIRRVCSLGSGHVFLYEMVVSVFLLSGLSDGEKCCLVSGNVTLLCIRPDILKSLADVRMMNGHKTWLLTVFRGGKSPGGIKTNSWETSSRVQYCRAADSGRQREAVRLNYYKLHRSRAEIVLYFYHSKWASRAVRWSPEPDRPECCRRSALHDQRQRSDAGNKSSCELLLNLLCLAFVKPSAGPREVLNSVLCV